MQIIFYIAQYHLLKLLIDNLHINTVIINLFENESKLRDHIYHIIAATNIAFHTFLTSIVSPKNINLLENTKNISNAIVTQYNMEAGMYLYDIHQTLKSKSYIFTLHHILTLYLMSMSYYNGTMNYGFYMFTLTNYTTVFLCLAKLTRNLKRKEIIVYTDLIFLVLFGYFRIYLFSKSILINYTSNLIQGYSFDLKAIYISIWLLQVFWFNKLLTIFINQHLQELLIHTKCGGKILRKNLMKYMNYRKLL